MYRQCQMHTGTDGCGKLALTLAAAQRACVPSGRCLLQQACPQVALDLQECLHSCRCHTCSKPNKLCTTTNLKHDCRIGMPCRAMVNSNRPWALVVLTMLGVHVTDITRFLSEATIWHKKHMQASLHKEISRVSGATYLSFTKALLDHSRRLGRMLTIKQS